jgi:hypothetical protein
MAHEPNGFAAQSILPEGFGLVTLRSFSAGSRFAIVLFALLMDAGLSLAHAQVKLDAAYRATLLGIPVGAGSLTVNLKDNQFAAAASGATSGLLRIFSSGQGSALARGTLTAGQSVGSNYALNITAGRWTDDLQISYSGGKAKEYIAVPSSPPNPNRVPLTDTHRTGVVDPMTALLIRVPGTGDTAMPQACERTIAVFDGRMRYDLRLGFKRLDTVRTETGYQGAVVVCSVNFVPVAGYDPERFLVKYLEAQNDMEISLAPVGDSRLLAPYRASLQTPMGLGVVQATRFVASLSTAMNLQ